MRNSVPPVLDDMLLLVEVVDSGGIFPAAARLGLRKSAVSRRLGALEERLGVRLFEHLSRPVRLTDLGRQYYEECLRIVRNAHEANRSLNDGVATPRGTLRITTTERRWEMLLGPVLAEYARRYKNAEVEVVFSQTRVDLVAGNFDAAIRVDPMLDASVESRHLGEARTGYYASPGYLKIRGTPRTPDEVHEHECILVAGTVPREEWPFLIDGKLRKIGVTGRLRVGSIRIGCVLVRSGMGIARLPEYLVADDVRSRRIVAVLEAFTPPSTSIQAVYPSGRPVSPCLRAFLDLLAEGPLVASSIPPPNPDRRSGHPPDS
jgi:DNA-binding transcriptional LysR family regulator